MLCRQMSRMDWTGLLRWVILSAARRAAKPGQRSAGIKVVTR